ncbi:hypothetical protein FQN55_002661 [Onygenales sp. PD_40]|nr:hypothetical protein FQN55_002661 [Onygenales sp. PD_40]
MSVKLVSLPVDLLMIIAENLEEQRDLAAFSITSKCCYDAAVPILYKTIEKIYFAYDQFLYLLVRTLLLKPSLRKYVRKLRLEDWCTHPGLHHHDRANVDPGMVEVLENSVAPFSHPDDEKEMWLQDLKCGYGDAYVGLLLTLIPNLRVLGLTITPTCVYPQRVIDRALNGNKPFDSYPAFPHLRCVELRRDSDIYCMMAVDFADPLSYVSDELKPIFMFPSIRYFSGANIISSDLNPFCRFESQMTHLRLSECMLSSSIESLVKSCRRLKTFQFSHHANSYVGSREPQFRTSDLNSWLEGAKQSIETLCITSNVNIKTGDQTGIDDFVGPFVDFRALERLHLSAPYLTNLCNSLRSPLAEKVLPASLRRLYIEDADKRAFPSIVLFVESLIQSWAHCVPQLADVTIQADPYTVLVGLHERVEEDMISRLCVARRKWRSNFDLLIQIKDLIQIHEDGSAKRICKFNPVSVLSQKPYADNIYVYSLEFLPVPVPGTCIFAIGLNHPHQTGFGYSQGSKHIRRLQDRLDSRVVEICH